MMLHKYGRLAAEIMAAVRASVLGRIPLATHQRMKKSLVTFRRSTLCSMLLHVLLLLMLVKADCLTMKTVNYNVFQVDIVNALPCAKALADGDTPGTKNRGQIIGETPEALSGVEKEEALPDIQQGLSPASADSSGDNIQEREKNPPEGELSDIPTHNPAPPMNGTGAPINSDDQSFRIGSLWKSQVKYTVETAWKLPPDISAVNTSLRTTYLLRISRNGELMERKLVVSSGNSTYDRSVDSALSNVRRFPVPPDIVIAGLDSVVLNMSFNPSAKLLQ